MSSIERSERQRLHYGATIPENNLWGKDVTLRPRGKSRLKITSAFWSSYAPTFCPMGPRVIDV